jgi:hypothetical protein
LRATRLGVQVGVRFRRVRANDWAELAREIRAFDGLSLPVKDNFASAVMTLAAAFGDAGACGSVAALIVNETQDEVPNRIELDWLREHIGRSSSKGWLRELILNEWLADAQTGNGLEAKIDEVPPNTLIVAPQMKSSAEFEDASILRDHDAVFRRFTVLAQPIALRGDFEVDEDGQFSLITKLHAEFPWFGNVIEALDAQMTLHHAMGQESLAFAPMLLVGPPGCGKTRFAMRLSQLSGCGYGAINAGGSSDNRLLAGTARGWATAMPCLPATIIAQSGCANPVILVDEIDKTATDPRNGRLVHTLLSMLETTSSKVWPDECLVTPLNLSRVNWIVTANTVKELDAPLLSRFDVQAVTAPKLEHFDTLLSGILADIAQDFHQNVAQLPMLMPQTIATLRSGFKADSSPRSLHRAIARALAGALRAPSRALN